MQDSPEQFEEMVAPAAAASAFSLRHFLVTLRRQWWILPITMLLPIGPAIYYVRTKPDQFVSQASMWVRGVLRMGEVGQYTEDVQNFFGTQIQLLESDTLRERALSRLRSTNPTLEQPRNANGRPTVPKIRVNQAPRSAVFNLESVSTSAAYAQAYLDALMDEFFAYRKEARAATSGDALASVSAQVYKQETELKQEQESLARFQRTNNVALLEENLRGGGSQLGQLNSQLALLKLELQLLDAAAIERSAGVNARTNALAAMPDLSRIPGVSSPAPGMPADFLSAQHQIQVLKAQREQWSRYMRPKHPKIVKLDEEIARAEKVSGFYQTQSQEQLAAAKEAMRLRIKSLEATVAELREAVGEANRQLSELERIRASIARTQSFYDRLLNLLQGVDLNSSMSQENVAILERASKAGPSKDQTVRVLAAAPFGGLALGLGIIFLLARQDDRCDSLIELRGHFAEQIFGQIPDVKAHKSNGTLPLLTLDDPRHIFAESCRNLRSSLLFGPTGGPRPKTLLVTSAAPEEGKSTIALNLACALAFGGARVLLVDGDIRRGHLHRMTGVPGEPGLAECVQESCDLAQCSHPTVVPKLFILPRGKPARGSGELFLAPAFDALVQRARQEFDYIVIDSIPVFAADDTTTLAPKVDGVLFVVRRAYTSAKLAQEALELLYQRQAKILGLVFNRADSKSASYRYYKYAKYYSEAPSS